MATSLNVLMKEIGQALKLDDDNKDEAAYQQYVSCIYKIATNLIVALRASRGEVVVDSKTVREVKLVQQCVERVASLVEKMVTTQPKSDVTTPTQGSLAVTPTTGQVFAAAAMSPENRSAPGAQTLGIASSPSSVSSPLDVSKGSSSSQMSITPNRLGGPVPPLHADNNPHTFRASKTRGLRPLELAQKQNQSLMAAYKARMKRLNRADFSAFNYSLTIQRKMAENIAIAQAQEEELAKKMQARNQRLEQEAAKRFAHPWGLSEEEQAQMQTYKKILEYENEAKWLQNWRKKLESNPEDPILINQLVQEILRCSDHPFTELLHKYQFKVYERLYPLIADKHEALDKIHVPFPREDWPSVEEVEEIWRQIAMSPVSPVQKTFQLEKSMTAGENTQTVDSSNDGKNDGGLVGETSGDDHGNESISTTDNEDSGSTTKETKREGRISSSSPEKTDSTWVDPLGVHLDVVENPNDQKDSVADVCDKSESELVLDNTAEGNGDKNSLSKVAESTAHQEENMDPTAEALDSQKEETNHNKVTVIKECIDGNEGVSVGSKDQMLKNVEEDSVEEDQDVKSSAVAEEESSAASGPSQMGTVVEKNKKDLSLALDIGKELESQLSFERKQAQILMWQVSQDYRNYEAGNTDMDEDNLDYLFDDDEESDSEDTNCYVKAGFSKSYRSNTLEHKTLPSINEVSSPNEMKPVSNVTFERSKSHQPQTSYTESIDEDSAYQSLPANFRKCDKREGEFSKLSEEAYQRHLRSISDDIHHYLEKLLTMMTISYEALDTPVGKDQCAVSLEEPFFKPIWKTLLRLFRTVNYKQEMVLACVMTKYAEATPEEMKVSKKFRLSDSQSSEKPYQKAITQLRFVQDHYTMLSKLECVVKVCRLICQCVDDHYSKADGKGKKAPSIGADDLLPVFSYVVIQSALPQLGSECQAMMEFIQEGYMMGEEGYCLTTLRTALNYLASLYPIAARS